MNIATPQDEKQRLNLDVPEGEREPEPITLKDADLDRLRAHLGQGLGGFARQGDIVELHKRIGEKFEKLPLELSSSDQARAAELRAEVESLQTALNSLEGALRIELAPMLQKTIADSLQSARTDRRGGWKIGFAVLAALCVGAGLGAAYQDAILAAAAQGQDYFSQVRAYLSL